MPIPPCETITSQACTRVQKAKRGFCPGIKRANGLDGPGQHFLQKIRLFFFFLLPTSLFLCFLFSFFFPSFLKKKNYKHYCHFQVQVHINATIERVGYPRVEVAPLCLVTQSCPTVCDPMDCSPPGSSVLGDSSGKNTRVGCQALLQGNLPNPVIEPRSPALQTDSLLTETPGKPKNTGVGSLSLFQGIFLTQESNWGLLH